MSKMKAPKMDVVRFNESDVIVASSGITISKYADATANNGVIKFGEFGEYTYTSQQATTYPTSNEFYHNLWDEFGMNPGTMPNVEYGEASYSIDSLTSQEYRYGNQNVSLPDGFYSWDGVGRFIKKQ